jgi:hypothetical protein
VGERGAVDPLHAEGVDVEQMRDVLGRERLDVADVEVTGVVHDHIELAGFT